MQKRNSNAGTIKPPPILPIGPPAAFGTALAILRHRQGFALLITVVLLAFLVLILVSLATLTRVETQVATNSQQLSLARQNALLGLNIAIGQLQKFAGPDQRITAPADVIANIDRNGTPVKRVGSGTAVPGKQTLSSGARYWTGVWGNAADPAASPDQRRFLNWLVSGNETVTLTSIETGTEFGRITSPEPAGSDLPVKATDSVGLTTSTRPIDDVIIGSRTGRMLVGPKSAGSDNADLVNYVAAPLVDIYVPKSQIPGLGTGSTNTTVGRYAYWVGDEGVKARINLINPWPKSTDAATAANERTWSFANAQRSAGERMDGLSSLTTDPVIVGNLITSKQINLATGGSLSTDVIGRRYHDFSMNSRSVLADVRRGGLKRDLTRILAPGGGSTDEASDVPLFPNLGSVTDPFYTRPATWGLLRDFTTYGTASTGNLQPRTPRADRTGISPVIMVARLDYTFTVSAPSNSSPTATQDWSAFISPVFILWNPYNRRLQGGNYEIGIQGPRKKIGAEERGLVTIKLTPPPSTPGDPPPPDQTMWLNLGNGHFEHPNYPPSGISPSAWSAPTLTRDFFRFTAVVPNLEPGQSVFIGLADSKPDYSPGMQLTARNYLAGTNYSNVARIRTQVLTVNVATMADISIPNTKRAGEVNVYLGIQGSGADPAAANLLGSSNYYQWLGRVEVSTPSALPDSYGPLTVNLATGTSGNPNSIASIQVWHQLGSANDFYTAPLQSRWIAAANPRAYMLNRTGMEYGGDDRLVVNPIYNGLLSAYSLPGGNTTLFVSYTNTAAPGGQTEARIGNDYNNSSFTPFFWPRPVLFEVPEQDQPLFSIADLRHAPVSGLITSPAYAIGNSIADFRVASTSAGLGTTSDSVDAGYLDPVGGASYGPGSLVLYDQSYLLNHALWDRYFFSTVPDTSSLPDKLPNSRYTYYPHNGISPEITDFTGDTQGRKTASLLLLDGGFNINSTSVDAWRAFLGGTSNILFNPLAPSDGSPSSSESPAGTSAFSRFRRPRDGWDKLTPGSNTNLLNYYGGYRRLNAAELDGLAIRMVAEVRERGPFLSVADFVNRSLSGTVDRTRLKGALQAAIDDEANNTPSTRINFINEQTNSVTGGGRHITVSGGKNPNAYAPFADVIASYHRAAYVGYETSSLDTAAGSYTRNDANFPGYLTQADMLATLGSSITGRSDTFVIRTYGETVNPVTGNVEGRAWCEATVQRLPDYVSSADPATTPVSELTDQQNRRLGRRFEVVSFRWLGPEDI
ncbi:MAG: hypothetical protein WC205_06915 [Opitutaceae bacterium]|jgi:hypothetical protein